MSKQQPYTPAKPDGPAFIDFITGDIGQQHAAQDHDKPGKLQHGYLLLQEKVAGKYGYNRVDIGMGADHHRRLYRQQPDIEKVSYDGTEEYQEGKTQPGFHGY